MNDDFTPPPHQAAQVRSGKGWPGFDEPSQHRREGRTMDVALLRNAAVSPVSQTYDMRDTILYALSLGYGDDPLNEHELPFVYERQLRCVPSFVNVLCDPGPWMWEPIYGIDGRMALHAEQEFRLHQPLPATGCVVGRDYVSGIEDKGSGRGALLHVNREIAGKEHGDRVATIRISIFLRGNGGEGGFGEIFPPPPPLPATPPHRVATIYTSPGQPLLYRLNGDWNPLHADPEAARRAGFDRPILHGQCLQGIACRAILAEWCNGDTARLRAMFVRFSQPVFPGETIRFEYYRQQADRILFRAVVPERNAIVLDRSWAEIDPSI